MNVYAMSWFNEGASGVLLPITGTLQMDIIEAVYNPIYTVLHSFFDSYEYKN